MSKSFFIDTTICTACRGCQVSCKQWHDLSGEKTINRGSYENPVDLSFNTYKLVRMRERELGGKLKWLFFPEQCRHCKKAPCLETAEDSSAIYKDSKTGAIIFTSKTGNLDANAIIEACPYNVPRKSADGTLAKCDMCLDRVQNGLKPACVMTCPTGTAQFGDSSEIMKMAEKRLAQVKSTSPRAKLVDKNDIRVIYLVEDNPMLYFKNAMASRYNSVITRQAAIRKMFRQLTDFVRVFEKIG